MNDGAKIFLGCTVACIILFAFIMVLMFGIPAYNRYQKVLWAENQVHVNEIIAKQTQQLIDNETQKARIRIEEAKGIAESQRLINQTLTDKYLQHEAIQAQFRMAGSPNHTQIYIPSGYNGIPLVKTVDSVDTVDHRPIKEQIKK